MSAEEMETVYGNTMLLSETCRPVLQVKIYAVAEASFKLLLTVNVTESVKSSSTFIESCFLFAASIELSPEAFHPTD